MSKTKFMPGPWDVIETSSARFMSVVQLRYASGQPGTVAMVGRADAIVGDSDVERQNATAHLISAGPDLYHALDGLLASCGARGRYHALENAEAIERAEAALRKARGETA